MNTLQFTVDQGATFIKQIRLKDAANNNAFITATFAEAQVRTIANSANIVASMNCFFSSQASNNDTLTIIMQPDQTQNFTQRKYNYDVKVFWPDQERFILGGLMIVNPTVTRP